MQIYDIYTDIFFFFSGDHQKNIPFHSGSVSNNKYSTLSYPPLRGTCSTTTSSGNHDFHRSVDTTVINTTHKNTKQLLIVKFNICGLKQMNKIWNWQFFTFSFRSSRKNQNGILWNKSFNKPVSFGTEI